jgi:hypothetical protein
MQLSNFTIHLFPARSIGIVIVDLSTDINLHTITTLRGGIMGIEYLGLVIDGFPRLRLDTHGKIIGVDTASSSSHASGVGADSMGCTGTGRGMATRRGGTR